MIIIIIIIINVVVQIVHKARLPLSSFGQRTHLGQSSHHNYHHHHLCLFSFLKDNLASRPICISAIISITIYHHHYLRCTAVITIITITSEKNQNKMNKGTSFLSQNCRSFLYQGLPSIFNSIYNTNQTIPLKRSKMQFENSSLFFVAVHDPPPDHCHFPPNAL